MVSIVSAIDGSVGDHPHGLQESSEKVVNAQGSGVSGGVGFGSLGLSFKGKVYNNAMNYTFRTIIEPDGDMFHGYVPALP